MNSLSIPSTKLLQRPSRSSPTIPTIAPQKTNKPNRAAVALPHARVVQSYACSEACSSITFLHVDREGACT